MTRMHSLSRGASAPGAAVPGLFSHPVKQQTGVAVQASARASLPQRAALALLVMVLALAIAVPVQASDAGIMNSIKNNFGWGQAFNWPDSPVCIEPWNGITCEFGRVVALEVTCGDTKLNQQLPPIIANLTAMERVAVVDCNLFGPIPERFYERVALREMNFLNNRLSGGLSGFPNLQNLRRLNLSANNFSGSIPAGLAQLTNLEELALARNFLSGRLDATPLADLTNNPGFTLLDVSENYFYGPIPADLPDSEDIRIDLADNFLSAISEQWTAFDRDISGNAYPVFPPSCDDESDSNRCRPNREDARILTITDVSFSSPDTATVSWTETGSEFHQTLSYQVLNNGVPLTTVAPPASSAELTNFPIDEPYLLSVQVSVVVATPNSAITVVFESAPVSDEAPSVCQPELFVDQAASGAGDGATWADAFTDLQDALALARTTCSGTVETIHVAEGVYKPVTPDDPDNVTQAERAVSFALIDGVALLGGYPAGGGPRDWRAHQTVLSGDIDGNDTVSDDGVTETWEDIVGSNSLHVVVARNVSAETVLDGFTVTGGRADLMGQVNNLNAFLGGGLYNEASGSENTSSPAIHDVAFRGNFAGGYGGAVSNVALDGTANPLFVNVSFQDNRGEIGGGAVLNAPNGGNASPSFVNASFVGNSADGNGGAVDNSNAGGTASPSFINVTFAGNSATPGAGGAVFNQGLLGPVTPLFVNSIFWDNSASTGSQIYIDGGTASLSYSIVEGGTAGNACGPGVSGSATCSSMIVSDVIPFVDAADPAGPDGIWGTEDDGLRLVDGHPAIDAGTNAPFGPGGIAENVTTDITGAPRIQDGTGAGAATVDLGPYERAAGDFPRWAVRTVTGGGIAINNINEAEALLASRPTAGTDTPSVINYANVNSFPGVSGNDFALEAIGVVDVIGATSGTFTLYVNSNDGFRLRRNGTVIGEFVGPTGASNVTIPNVTLNDGDVLRLTFFQRDGGAFLRLRVDDDTGPFVGAPASGINIVPLLLERREVFTTQGCVQWMAPAVVSGSVHVRAVGSAGEDTGFGPGGTGDGYAASIAVAAGESLRVCVDVGGGAGGPGVPGTPDGQGHPGGAGGGASGVSRGTTFEAPLLVAAGGGGGGGGKTGFAGGAGGAAGHPAGVDGGAGIGAVTIPGGKGATQSAPGAGGSNPDAGAGQGGSGHDGDGPGQGGAGGGGSTASNFDGGGGGAGLWGGGGGAPGGGLTGGGGGGGSSHCAVANPRVSGCERLPGVGTAFGAGVNGGAEVVLTFSVPLVCRAEVFVDRSASGANDGSSWSNAFTDLQDALKVARSCIGTTTEIHVAEGVYKPVTPVDPDNVTQAERAVSFALIDGVALLGGYSSGGGTRDWRAHPTVLSGDIDGNDDVNDDGVTETWEDIVGSNSFHVLTALGVSATAVVEGFTVTAGLANVNVEINGIPADWGGGLYARNASPTLRDVVLQGNTATAGGAVSAYGPGGGTSSPTFTNATFQGNSALLRGGAVYAVGEFGGTSSPSLVNSILWGNEAPTGPQIQHLGVGSLTLSHALVEGATVSDDCGGGIVGTATCSDVVVTTQRPFVDEANPAGPDGIWATEDDGLRLRADSPAIDSGTNAPFQPGGSAEGVTTDITGAARIFADIVDLGPYEAVYRTVSPSAGTGGSIAPDQPTRVLVGDQLELTLTPNPGFSIATVGGSCGGTLDGNVFMTAPIIEDCTVVASFAIDIFTVTASVGAGQGSITPLSQNVEFNGTAGFTVTPETGWSIQSVIGDTCTPALVDGNQWAATGITEACAVTANFAINVFTVTAAVGAGQGTITPLTQNVVFNGTAGFTVVPQTGWSIQSVTGDTCTPEPVSGSEWAASNIQQACAVEARFAIDTYNVTAEVGEGEGTITPDSQIVNHGAAATFTVTPSLGWSVTTVVGDTCTPELDSGDQWIAAEITEACAVTANFAQDTFEVTAEVVAGEGSITPASQNVVFDGTATFAVTPQTGWSIESVTGDTCTPEPVAGDQWEATGIQQACAVEARFVINTYTVTAEVGEGEGAITPDSQVVAHGTDATFTVTPDLGWSVSTVTGSTCTPELDSGDQWVAAEITEACAVTANFAQDTFEVTAEVVAGEGSITPASQNVVFDGTATFTVTPQIGWSIQSVTGDTCTPALVDGNQWAATGIQEVCAVEVSFVINTYTVTAEVGDGQGAITPESQVVANGSDATFTVTPDLGWSVTTVTGSTCSPELVSGDQWVASNITEDCAVTANFAIDVFEVTAEVGAGQGSILPPTQNVEFDGAANFTVVPETGWSIQSVTGDTCTPALVDGNQWAASNIQQACAVEASFVINTYTVTAEIGEGEGSITPDSQVVAHGSNATFTVTPSLGWSVTTVTGSTCSPELVSGDQWVAAEIIEDCSVVANFAQDTFEVTAEVVAGEGSITPTTQNVVFDGTATFTVVPETGWSIQSVTGDTCTPALVDGNEWAATGITEACAVEARFVINTYTVTAEVGEGEGEITPESQVVEHGSNATFTVTPDLGWSVTSVVGSTCSPELDSGDQWVAAEITEACAVTANFAQDTFEVTAEVVAGEGSIAPASQNVVFDGTASFTVVPETGWSIQSVTGDTCTPALVDGNEWQATGIQQACAVEARFVINTYTVTAEVGVGEGEITPASQDVAHGDDAIFTVSADTGWSITSVVGDTCTPSLDSGNQWMAENITEDCAITANFARIVLQVDRPELSFSSEIGVVQSETLRLANSSVGTRSATAMAGQVVLTIEQMLAPNPPFGLDLGSCQPLPLSLTPGEFCELTISFSTEVPGISEDELTIISNADSSPDRIMLRGVGLLPAVPVPAMTLPGLLLLVLVLLLLSRQRYRANR